MSDVESVTEKSEGSKVVFDDEVPGFAEAYDRLVAFWRSTDISPTVGCAVMMRMICDQIRLCKTKEQYFEYLELCKSLWPEE